MLGTLICDQKWRRGEPRVGFSQIDYQQLHASFAHQHSAGITRYLPRRMFNKLDNWSNPAQIPCQIDAHGNLVGAENVPPVPAIQRKAITAIRENLQRSKTGAALLVIADSGRISSGFEFVADSRAAAGYYNINRDVLFNINSPLMAHDRVEPFIDLAGYIGAHELAHVAQDKHCGRDFGRWDIRYTLMHQMMATRHYEAAADAVAVDVAWQLKQAGAPGMWRRIEQDPAEQHLARSFSRSVARNAANATNGKARRAVHDAWFKNKASMGYYDQGVLDRVRSNLDMLSAHQLKGFTNPLARATAHEAGRLRVHRDQLRDYGTMPDGGDHLRLTGHPDVWDEKYTAPSSPAMLRQAQLMDEMIKRMASGSLLLEDDFAALDDAKKVTEADTPVQEWRSRRLARKNPVAIPPRPGL